MEIATQNLGIDALNSLIMGGDMSKLSSKQKLDYYYAICTKIGLNPLTKPFDYMRLNGKEILYANKGAAEQIRNIRGISITSQHIEWTDELVIVTVNGKDRDGRVDIETGFANCLNLKGEAKGNALLKATTKAKRRLTFSMSGLGMMDETEVDSIPAAQKIASGEVVDNDGVIIEKKPNLLVYQEPREITLTSRYSKTRAENETDWRLWAKSFYASLKAAPDSEYIIEWIDLNQENYDLLKDVLPEVYDKIEDLINSKIDRALDTKSIETDMAEFKEAV